MQSPKALLFLSLQALIQSLMTDDDVPKPHFPFIERDMAQLDNGSKPPVVWPCVLVRILDGNYLDQTNKAQRGIMTVSIRIGFPPRGGTSNAVPAKYRNEALYFFELEQIMFRALHAWHPTTVIIEPEDGATPAVEADISNMFGSLMRVQDVEEDRDDFLTVAKQLYTISIDDNTAVEEIVYATVTPVITPQLDLTIEE